MFQGIISAVANAGGVLTDRFILSKKKIDYRSFTTLAFSLIVLILLFLIPFFYDYSPQMFSTENLIYLGFIAFFGILFNFLLFYGLKYTKAEAAEPLILTSWLFTVLLAVTFYPEERNTIKLILALIASVTIFLTHIKKHHLVFHKGTMAILFSSLIIAIHDMFIKKLLVVYNPFTLYFIRCLIITILLLIIVRPNKKYLKRKYILPISLVATLGVLEYVFKYWSYDQYGLVYTSLLMTLAPLLVMCGSKFFLKEKIEGKNIISMVVILACIVISLYF